MGNFKAPEKITFEFRIGITKKPTMHWSSAHGNLELVRIEFSQKLAGNADRNNSSKMYI